MQRIRQIYFLSGKQIQVVLCFCLKLR